MSADNEVAVFSFPKEVGSKERVYYAAMIFGCPSLDDTWHIPQIANTENSGPFETEAEARARAVQIYNDYDTVEYGYTSYVYDDTYRDSVLMESVISDVLGRVATYAEHQTAKKEVHARRIIEALEAHHGKPEGD